MSVEAIPAVLSQIAITRYTYVSACVIYGYDYALTFSQEFEHIWKRRLTLPTIAFLLLRYTTPLELILSVGIFSSRVVDAFSCKVLINLVGALNIFAVILIGCIMAIRTVALYNRNKIIIGFLSILMTSQIIALAIFTSEVRVRVGNNGMCITLSPTDLYITGLWWCPLGFDTTVFILTVIRLVSLRKRSRRDYYSLFHLMLRDGVSYYMAICLVYAINTINWTSNPGLSMVAGLNFGLSIPAISICRLTLNLQGVHSRPEDNLNTTTTTNDVDFGVLTTVPSLTNGAVWLTGERWDSIYVVEDPAVEERELQIVVGQTSTTHK